MPVYGYGFNSTNNPGSSGLPIPTCLSHEEVQEYYQLIEIIQQATGIGHIASNGLIMTDDMCKPLCERLCQLIKKNDDIEENKKTIDGAMEL